MEAGEGPEAPITGSSITPNARATAKQSHRADRAGRPRHDRMTRRFASAEQSASESSTAEAYRLSPKKVANAR
jgi:hypothetical protein